MAALSSLVVAIGGSQQVLAQPVHHKPRTPIDTGGKQIVAVAVFAGQGDTTNVDTGLTYEGARVSPTWVGITPSGFQMLGSVGVFPHQSDTFIDVQVSGGLPWTGLALYVQ
ncbi:MAG: hypothetical protein ABI406_00115 [Ktedonobacteraceae bacterium]